MRSIMNWLFFLCQFERTWRVHFQKNFHVITVIETERKEVNAMNKKQPVAIKASQILRDGRYGSKAKSVAGSALAQTKNGKRK